MTQLEKDEARINALKDLIIERCEGGENWDKIRNALGIQIFSYRVGRYNIPQMTAALASVALDAYIDLDSILKALK